MKGTKPNLKVVEGGMSKTPAAPSWMNDDAKREWRRIMPGLVQRRILTKEDMGQIENLCLQMAQVRQMQRTIDSLDDPFVYAESGAPRPHPAYRAQRDAMTTARQIAAEFGLTPVSRSRPSMAPEGSSADDWAGLVDE